MTTVDVLRPTAVGDKSGAYHPMEPKPQPQVGWAQSIIDSLGDLLIPERAPTMQAPVSLALPEKYCYEALSTYVVNVLGPKQMSFKTRLKYLTPNDVEGITQGFSHMREILQMTAQAQVWIQAHKAEHRKVGARKFVTIKHKLERSQSLLGEFFKYLPVSGEMLKPAPEAWTPQALRSPGIPNEQNGCFMNSTLQGIFGDPICRKYIALNPQQHDTVRLHAMQFAAASHRKDFTPLSISKEIRSLYGLADGKQHDAHEAMMGLIGLFQAGKTVFQIVMPTMAIILLCKNSSEDLSIHRQLST